MHFQQNYYSQSATTIACRWMIAMQEGWLRLRRVSEQNTKKWGGGVDQWPREESLMQKKKYSLFFPFLSLFVVTFPPIPPSPQLNMQNERKERRCWSRGWIWDWNQIPASSNPSMVGEIRLIPLLSRTITIHRPPPPHPFHPLSHFAPSTAAADLESILSLFATFFCKF